MKLEYEVRPEETRALQEYHVNHSPATKKRIRNVRLIYLILAVVFAAGAVLFGMEGNLVLTLVAGVMAAVLLAACWLMPLIIRRSALRILRSRNEHQENEGPRKHKLYLTDEGMTIIISSVESKFSWKALDRVVNTEQYLFILLNRNFGSLVVPKRVLAGEAEYQELLKVFRSHGGRVERGGK